MINTFIFDWKRTLYNPDSKTLIEGTDDILRFLRKHKTKVILIGKGGQDMYEEVARLGISDYFDHVQFDDGPKKSSQFAVFIDTKKPRDTVIIGDRVKSELAVGNELGATTIWVRQGKFFDEVPAAKNEEPVHVVASLKELLQLISSGMIG